MPRTLDNMIESENECEYVDFKKEFCIYRSDKDRCDFLKDVMAFANSDLTDEKFIVFGVDLGVSPRNIVGIASSVMPDPASIQEFVRENIEPDLGVECFVYSHNGKSVGVIKIFNCTDKPYVAKKDFHETKPFGIHAGDSYIRVGSRKDRVLRRDIDNIFASKAKEGTVRPENVDVVFTETGNKELVVQPLGDLKLPSMQEREKIEAIIQGLRQSEEQEWYYGAGYGQMRRMVDLAQAAVDPFHQDPYRGMSIPELQKELEEVETNFREDDLHFLFEENGLKLNLQINNSGRCFIEGATVLIELPDVPGLLVANQIHHQPDRSPYKFMGAFSPSIYSASAYPKVTKQDGKVRVETSIGDVKQTIPVKAFSVPPRFVISRELSGKEIEIGVSIIGKNTPDPIKKKIIIRVKPV